MSGTFAPAPGAAPLARQVRAQASMETRLMLRNGEQLLVALVIPALALVGGVVAGRRGGIELEGSAVDTLTPGVLALAVMSTAFTSLAIATGFERRYGLIKRLGASPLPRHGLLLGKLGALLVVQVVQACVLVPVALGLGWSPDGGLVGVLAALLAVLLGAAAFASLGLLMAGTLRAEATLAAANLVYLLLLVGGAVVLPRSSYGAAGDVLQVLPSAALGDALRTAFLDGQVAVVPLLVLVGWTVVGATAVSRLFRWE
ncbi:ABC transporter permease [Nocardioides zeae]|uniref:ABC transporter permease n=1 Tax=Nocardioides imazamoxiresistens TaxID=3231893 RepID=A0ABU3PUH5_9ACTN|nr:ABC transporter permease [Nocardioides zeae]MDT9592440.1 ABC transporter permease [Nocardioides zeae]